MPLGSMQQLTPGDWASGNRYIAPADGFVHCAINSPGSSSPGCVAWGYAYTRGLYVQVTGGNMGFFGKSWVECQANNPQSGLLPVGQGDPFYVGLQQASGSNQQADAPSAFCWLSLSGAHVGSFVKASRAADPDFEPPPLPQMDPIENPDRGAFVDILERLLGKPIDAETRKQLATLRI
jgi:hypothetical protein